jgi:hypothetical protein
MDAHLNLQFLTKSQPTKYRQFITDYSKFSVWGPRKCFYLNYMRQIEVMENSVITDSVTLLK